MSDKERDPEVDPTEGELPADPDLTPGETTEAEEKQHRYVPAEGGGQLP